MTRGCRLVLALGLLGTAVSSAVAQTTSATIVGTVRTSRGDPLRGVVVQARSGDTGKLRTAISGDDGAYRIEAVEPGRWTVAVRIPGDPVVQSRALELRLQQTVRVDFTLDATSTSETIKVTAEAPVVDPGETAVKLLVTQDQIGRIPLANRAFTDLAKLDSSVGGAPTGVYSGERGPAFVTNGQGARSNSFLVDGLDNNDPVSGTNLNSFYSAQVIKEFTLLLDQYAPEFGRASGGVLNIVTRGGSNEPFGQGFAQGTHDAWNETSGLVESLPGGGASQRALSRYTLGFNFGGRFKRDRAFWFVAFERQASRSIVPYTGTTRDGVAGGSLVSQSDDRNLFFRADFNLGANHTLMVRAAHDQREDDGVNVVGVYTPENGFTLEERDVVLAATLKSVLGPDLVHEARLMASQSRFEQRAVSDRTEVARPSSVFGGNNLNRQRRDEDRLQFVDNVSWRRGRHVVKFGLDVVWSRIDLRAAFNPNGGLIYESDVPFDPNDPETYAQVYLFVDGQPADVLRDTQLALFVQDSWEAGGRFHFNYGLRYDLTRFVLGEETRVDSVVPNGGSRRDTDNLAPRFGFSFTPGARGRLVLRGGAGVFYDKLVLGFPAVAAITSQTRIGLYFPQGFQAPLDENLVDELGGQFISDTLLDSSARFVMQFSTATDLETPYTVQYNFGLDLATGARSYFRVNAVRSLGYHLPLLLDLNPASGLIPNGVECNEANLLPFDDENGVVPCHIADPQTGSIAAISTRGRSWYWALDTSWRWHASGGSWFSASHTLSRAEDLGFDPLKDELSIPPESTDLASERGRADGDRRHRFVVSADFPVGWGVRTSGVLRWSSGAAFNVISAQDRNLDGILTDRPSGVSRNSGADTPLGPVNELRQAWGLSQVASLDEPDFLQVDVRAYKRFPFAEARGTAELFLQVFNLFDRENVGLIETRVINPGFGKAAALAGPPRTVELGLKVGY